MIVRKITGHDADERNGSAFFVVKLAINIKFLSQKFGGYQYFT
jgi:hypothetical protein